MICDRQTGRQTDRKTDTQGKTICLPTLKGGDIIRVSIILKMLIFHSFKASGSTFYGLHQRLLKPSKEAAISLRHLGKSILEGNLYFGPLEIILRTLASGMTLRLPVITCPAEGY